MMQRHCFEKVERFEYPRVEEINSRNGCQWIKAENRFANETASKSK